MRVFIAVDMEGATGIAHREQLMPGGQDYERARRLLTGDVRAAVEGAVDAGADEVWVCDGHGVMRNLLVDELPEVTRVVIGPAQTRQKPLVQVQGIEQGEFAAAMFIGFHSRAGTPGGLLSHTWVGMLVHEIRLDGRVAGETLLDAALCGHYGVPVVLVSGADDVCREAREDLGEAVTCVEVKRALGPSACASLTPARAQKLIREAAAQAIMGCERCRPIRAGSPCTLEVDFHRREMAERALETGVGERLGDRTVRYRAADMPQAVAQLWRGFEEALREDGSFLK
jgi:D-amino peptidase